MVYLSFASASSTAPSKRPLTWTGQARRVRLAKQQAEFAVGAMEFFGRAHPRERESFFVEGLMLTVPFDASTRMKLVSQDIWPIEISLDIMQANGEITGAPTWHHYVDHCAIWM